MSKPNKIPSSTIAPSNPDAETPRDPNDEAYAEWEDNVDLQKIRDILGSHDISGGKVRLERKGPVDQVYQYITTVPIEQFDIDHIKKTFGGGDYIARTFRANGQMYKPFNFSIDYRFKGALDEAAIKEMRNAPAQDQSKIIDAIGRVAGDGAGNANAMLKMMEINAKQQESAQMMMMKMMMDSQERQLLMMKEMFSAIKPQPAQQVDFGTAITPILIEMIKGKSTSPIGETIQMMKELRDFAHDGKVSEPEKDEDMIEKLIKVGLSVLPGMLGKSDQNDKSIADTAAKLKAQIPADHTIANMKIKAFTEQLIRAAQKNSDPVLYFELIHDMLDDNQISMLKQALTDSAWRANLFPSDPRIDQLIGWFEDLRQLILSDGQDIEYDNDQTKPGSIQPEQQPPTDSAAA